MFAAPIVMSAISPKRPSNARKLTSAVDAFQCFRIPRLRIDGHLLLVAGALRKRSLSRSERAVPSFGRAEVATLKAHGWRREVCLRYLKDLQSHQSLAPLMAARPTSPANCSR